MLPWYKGYKGSITPVPETPGRYECNGVADRRGQTRVEITELPVQFWTQDYKEWLMESVPKNPDDLRKSLFTEFREYHTESSVHFSVTMTPDKLADAERRGLQKVFHVKGSLSTTNMMLFDAEGKIKKYDTAE